MIPLLKPGCCNLYHKGPLTVLLQVLNTGRLLKCSQSYSEENDGLQKQAVAELARRMQQLESAVSSANQHQLQWEAAQDSALQVASLCLQPADRLQCSLHQAVYSVPSRQYDYTKL